ncbi:MAG: arpA protein [Gammaproteobacteria bacterium]|nr:MAG: arpA protein [Gammaproteobacteria bacterium]PIE36693.1 MAG: arpA protein [Gammaproteobacteria bacterium]
MNQLDGIVDTARYPITDASFRDNCRRELDANGVLVLPDFLLADSVARIIDEGDRQQHLAYYTSDTHNAYLKPADPDYPSDHPRNLEVTSSKGCITTDQIPPDSDLHTLYNNESFRDFLCSVLGIDALYEYADDLSSINLHYAGPGQELGWHFDNSSFALTLLIRKPEAGGVFEYVKDLRDADAGEMNYEGVADVLNGKQPVEQLAIDAGGLVLFRGRNSLHRVTPTEGDVTRMLVVLAYNTEPGVALSESARMTFYGRLS